MHSVSQPARSRLRCRSFLLHQTTDLCSQQFPHASVFSLLSFWYPTTRSIFGKTIFLPVLLSPHREMHDLSRSQTQSLPHPPHHRSPSNQFLYFYPHYLLRFLVRFCLHHCQSLHFLLAYPLVFALIGLREFHCWSDLLRFRELQTPLRTVLRVEKNFSY